jgi:hypothetical protein
MFVHRWPWHLGTCDARRCPCDKNDLQWVIYCYECGTALCEYNTMDSCSTCGMPVCPAPQCRDHRCHRPHDVFTNPELQCRHCRQPQEIGISHCCEVCREPQCIANRCKSHIRTCWRACCRDACGDCATLVEFPETIHTETNVFMELDDEPEDTQIITRVLLTPSPSRKRGWTTTQRIATRWICHECRARYYEHGVPSITRWLT